MILKLTKDHLRHRAHDFLPWATLCIVLLPPAPLSAQNLSRAKGVAPANSAILSDTLSGSYFIAKPLKEEYDRLLAQVEALKHQLDEERVTGPQAEERLRALRGALRDLRENIERTKLLVPVAKVHTVKETTNFELGPERCLVITADQVKLVSSEDSQVHCVLEKICLSADDQPADAELAAIKLIHRPGSVPWGLGKAGTAGPPMPLATSVPKVLGKAGQNLQGKLLDTVTIEGLIYEQGNRQIILEAQSPGGTTSVRSQWRRHAALTVAVPKCKSVIVQGSLSGLDVQGVSASLFINSAGSRDRDYAAQFRIQKVRGNVVITDFPVNLVADVQGDVSIETLRDFANSGTRHVHDSRQFYWFRPLACRCVNIRGNLHVRLGRMSLELQGIRGQLDVQNDFGDTTMALNEPLAAGSHRLSSVSGRVEVQAQRAALEQLPMVIATNYGTVRTNTRSEQFPDFNIGSGEGVSNARAWSGFRHAIGKANAKNQHGPGEEVFSIVEMLQGKSHPPGLVLFSQAGAVVFDVRNTK
jgi:hypothetical protein